MNNVPPFPPLLSKRAGYTTRSKPTTHFPLIRNLGVYQAIRGYGDCAHVMRRLDTLPIRLLQGFCVTSQSHIHPFK